MTRQRLRPGSSAWFAPKRYGFGATPATWQGWLLTAVFVVALIMAGERMPTDRTKLAVGLALTAAFVAIVAVKTEGGWRWRWRWRRDE